MKLLFDENLSDRLPRLLRDVFPDATQVKVERLLPCSDEQIWAYAAAKDFAIVTKDRDFNLRAIHQGPPPKVIFLTVGNCSTRAIEQLLRNNALEIAAFLADNVTSVMVLPK